GITHILCTPHHNNGRYENLKATVVQAVALLQAELDKEQIALTLFEGQEVRISGELLQEINNDQLLFTDLGDTYLLIELPTMDIPAYTEELFFELRTKGKVPVFVHPERNAKFREDPNRLLPYLEMGCLAQLTAPSLVGTFGKSIQKTAHEMVEHNLVQMMASDAHGVHKRKFHLKEAYELIEKEKAELMQQVAKDLVNGDQVTYPSPERVKKRKFGLF
ncbi:MAG: tyrosine protein phosphatase, partial [Tetragenococcus koreensis]|nr:tyrosine protein phosphatase [Tetragenococcus koreensis]